MAVGSIRAYAEEEKTLRTRHKYILRAQRTAFRKQFRTVLWESLWDDAPKLKTLRWGAVVELPDGLSGDAWTKVKSGSKVGYVDSAHVVEVAYVNHTSDFQVELRTEWGGVRRLLWGDLVQVIKRGAKTCTVRARGSQGILKTAHLTSEALLEVYFVDVGQGDGVLVRTPDGRHMLIDGGLERTKQLTGKNAADFVDWKFFADYGDFRIRLDSLMASHSDNDHYGGLHDLVRPGARAERELDCDGVDIKVLHHPGLSRWSVIKGANPPHRQGLGPREDGAFTRLLDDRADAEACVADGAREKLSGPWGRFVRDVLANSSRTKVERILVDAEVLSKGRPLPRLWKAEARCDVVVLGPVATKIGGKQALVDFKKKSFNTNGHSICLRLDYGKARILLTGDLNKKSMDWLAESYGDRMGAWECDVAKACHHGSHDISYRFLEKMCPAATVISSGDAEGHAHPRPEIVGASATTGYRSVDRKTDRLRTPLVYMTEIERSVSLGALNRIDIRQLPVAGKATDACVLTRNLDELDDRGHMTPEARREIANAERRMRRAKTEADKSRFKKKRDKLLKDLVKEESKTLGAMEHDMRTGKIDIDLNLTVPQGPLGSRNVRKRAWRSRVMEDNHYGLVNVRTDGTTIMCATLNETEEKWVVHSFPARF